MSLYRCERCLCENAHIKGMAMPFHRVKYCVECANCGFCGPMEDTREDAVKAWNKLSPI